MSGLEQAPNADSAPTDRQQKPHRLTAGIDRWGEVAFHVECPYRLGEERPCSLFGEAKDCTDDGCPQPWLEFGHGHPIEGCAVQHYIAELGWQDAVRWEPVERQTDLALPADVRVWCDEDGVEMGPWVQSGSTEVDRG